MFLPFAHQVMRPIRPDAHVIRLQLQSNPVLQPQALDVGVGQLQTAGPVDHRELLGYHSTLALIVQLFSADHLG
ncbi:hypothetical protein [Ornithinimicrobium sp. INDO-MA30-4]|uniref:hypothetical protein n=1 Tax=Ornithinimicrobium sp. INDO-MA30-4 TaxID=2908651 RepID=UPI0037C67768